MVPGSSRTSPTRRSTCRHWIGSTSLLIRQPVTYANVTTGRMASGRCASTASYWLAFEEADANVVLAQHGKVRFVMKLPRFDCEADHPLQYRQLAIDLAN